MRNIFNTWLGKRRRGWLGVWLALLAGALTTESQGALRMALTNDAGWRLRAFSDDGIPAYLVLQSAGDLARPEWLNVSSNVLAPASVSPPLKSLPGDVFFRAMGFVPPDYGTNDWPETMGTQRAWLEVDGSANAVHAIIPWRLPVLSPTNMDLTLMDSQTGQRITNLVVLAANLEYGQIVFQPMTVPGRYYLYYLPSVSSGGWWMPRTSYTALTNQSDSAWLAAVAPEINRIGAGAATVIPHARVVRLEALNEFHQFNEMERPATSFELATLAAAQGGAPFRVFLEDREHPIRMTNKLPQRWLAHGLRESKPLQTRRQEFFTFQIGVYASAGSLNNVQLLFSDLQDERGTILPAAAFRCFNLRGTNWLGEAFEKQVDVTGGKVQAFWVGVDVASNAVAGVYTGAVAVVAAGVPAVQVPLKIEVLATALPDRGDADVHSMSRLRWLDSSLGISYDTIAPFPPVAQSNRIIRVLGREIGIGEAGLPASIKSFFSRSNDRLLTNGVELLAEPAMWQVVAGGQSLPATNRFLQFETLGTGAVRWRATNFGDGFSFSVTALMESDGHLDYQVRFVPAGRTAYDDLGLRLVMNRGVAKYFMGMGRQGGLRPAEHHWRWSAFGNFHAWMGEANAGLYLKLKHKVPRWDRAWPPLFYQDWRVSTNSGCDFTEDAQGNFQAFARTGPVQTSGAQDYHFSLIVTPFKTLPPEHWDWRYYHSAAAPPVDGVTNGGARIINIHQDLTYNPYINYPFLTTNALADYIRTAHLSGVKVKLYYTVRELSVHTPELWALRSLGSEVYQTGGATDVGWAWLHEHLGPGFVTAWHQPLGNGRWDAAIATQGLSRWHNYYIEGVGWLAREMDLDGLYLDGLGYDRQIIKRLRRVLQAAKPGALLDLHDGDGSDPTAGNFSTVCMYMEHLPYLDSIWFGEYYNYDLPPEYWLLEVSGIPFGLFGEMLWNGGNPWRGMLFGISNRWGWFGDPRQLWKIWDEFGIKDARLIGWWDESVPVRTDDPQVKATCYVRDGRTLIALASWAPEARQVTLSIDWNALGLSQERSRLDAPAILNFQNALSLTPQSTITVEPGRGWLFYLQEF